MSCSLAHCHYYDSSRGRQLGLGSRLARIVAISRWPVILTSGLNLVKAMALSGDERMSEPSSREAGTGLREQITSISQRGRGRRSRGSVGRHFGARIFERR